MTICDHPQHLSRNDRRILAALRIEPWECPGCLARLEASRMFWGWRSE